MSTSTSYSLFLERTAESPQGSCYLHRSSINHSFPAPSPPLGKEGSGTVTHRCVGLNLNSSTSFSYKDSLVWGPKKPCPKSQVAHWKDLTLDAIFPGIRELCNQTRNTNGIETQGDSEIILAPKIPSSIWIKKFLTSPYSGGIDAVLILT